MDIKQKFEISLHEAIRSSNDIAKRTIRMTMTIIKLAEVEKGKPLDDVSIISIIQKEIKTRHEMIFEAQKISRIDIIRENQDEIAILESFLPIQMGEIELEVLVRDVILELNAKGKQDMGNVMKALVPRIQGKASNEKVSQMVKRLLEN